MSLLALLAAQTQPTEPPPEPVGFYPPTTDPLITLLRPPVESFVKVYEVNPTDPTAHGTITAAYAAIAADRAAAGISGIGPQDYVGVRVHPGDYNERLRPPTWSALVGTTGDPADVRVWYDYGAPGADDMAPVMNPTGSCYVEGITLESLANFSGDPGAGHAPATLWQINAAPHTSVQLVNIVSRSDNEWCNTGAFQPGDANHMWAYGSTFQMAQGSQPVNAQTAQVWRSTDPTLASDMAFIDCEASCPEGLVVGIADLGYGAHDRFIWKDGTIHFDPEVHVAAFFHSSFMQAQNPEQPYNCVSYCTPEVPYAGEGEHYWSMPSDLMDSAPVDGLGPHIDAHFYPQALTAETTLAPAVVTASTGSPVANRWYFLPIDTGTAYNLRGVTQQVNAYAGSGGQVKYGLWVGTTTKDKPVAWRTLGASTPLAVGTATMGRGTYKNTRLYPGESLWLGVCFTDAAVTIPMDSGLAGSRPVYYQDGDGSTPASPTPALLASGSLTPIATILTGANP